MRDFFKRTRKELQLYGAFLLTTLGDRMWMFVIGLFLNKVGGISWVATAQLTESGLKLGVLTLFGHFFDTWNRSRLIQGSLFLNNLAVTVSAALFGYMFIEHAGNPPSWIIILAVLFAAVSRVASEIQRICFTKDWVVVISKSDSIKLEKVNSSLLAIDQSSSLILPILTGKLLDAFPWEVVCISIICYNLISWFFEATILLNLYNHTEELKSKESEIKGDDELRGCSGCACSSVNTYFRQSSWMAGFGLSLLYMTVLGFDNLAASYGQKHGMSSESIGYFRSFGSLLGLLGAFVYQFVASKVGLLWTVMIGLLWQNIFINTSGVAVLLPGSTMDVSGFISNTSFATWSQEVYDAISQPETQDFVIVPFEQISFSVTLFFVGISLARFGLWLADPAITQIQQETIPEQQRYAVFTLQTGFCEFFSIIKDIIVILLPFTSLFGLLTLGSCAFVFTGFMFNVAYHIKCGVSCHNKNMHAPKKNECEMAQISDPERQSLMEKNNPESKTEFDESGKLDE